MVGLRMKWPWKKRAATIKAETSREETKESSLDVLLVENMVTRKWIVGK